MLSKPFTVIHFHVLPLSNDLPTVPPLPLTQMVLLSTTLKPRKLTLLPLYKSFTVCADKVKDKRKKTKRIRPIKRTKVRKRHPKTKRTMKLQTSSRPSRRSSKLPGRLSWMKKNQKMHYCKKLKHLKVKYKKWSSITLKKIRKCRF